MRASAGTAAEIGGGERRRDSPSSPHATPPRTPLLPTHNANSRTSNVETITKHRINLDVSRKRKTEVRLPLRADNDRIRRRPKTTTEIYRERILGDGSRLKTHRPPRPFRPIASRTKNRKIDLEALAFPVRVLF